MQAEPVPFGRCQRPPRRGRLRFFYPPLSLTPRPPGQADFCPVATLVNKFLLAKAGCNCSDRYLRQLHVSLTSFAQGRMRIDASAVTAEAPWKPG
jgi:hypothetical protein